MTAVDSLPIVHPADHLSGPPQGHWTYRDYATLSDDKNRYEVIDGVLYMAPAPVPAHQSSVVRIARYLLQYVEDAGLGRVFVAPIDVELAPHVVVQPDVLVILHARIGIITSTHIIGTPDLIIEVASPGTAGYDRREKQNTYAQAGAPEYWIVDPMARTVEVLTLENGTYSTLGVFQGHARVPSQIVPALPVPVERFFE